MPEVFRKYRESRNFRKSQTSHLSNGRTFTGASTSLQVNGSVIATSTTHLDNDLAAVGSTIISMKNEANNHCRRWSG